MAKNLQPKHATHIIINVFNLRYIHGLWYYGGNIDDKSNVSTVFNGLGTVPNDNDGITLEITFDADAFDHQFLF